MCLGRFCATQGCGVRFEPLLYAWLATAPLCLSSVQRKGEERRGEERTKRRLKNAGERVLASTAVCFFIRGRYFAEEFNEELPHNLRPASLFSRAFLLTFIILVLSLTSGEPTPRAREPR